MHSFQNFIVWLIPNHPLPLETRIWKLVVRALLGTIDIYLSGLLARRQNAWSQDGGNMRVIANGVNR